MNTEPLMKTGKQSSDLLKHSGLRKHSGFLAAFLSMMFICGQASAAEIGPGEAAADSSAVTKKKKEKKNIRYNEKGEIIKTGLNFGPLPAIAFDNDRGFQFGAILNIYNFGDGSTYPNPKSTWYIEGSGYTKGSYKFTLNYDNKYIFKNTRLSFCSGYYDDSALDFYGFNGYQSIYDLNAVDYVFSDDNKGQKLQKSALEKDSWPKGFYRHGRKLVKAKVDFTGKITEHFYWEAGYNFNWIKTGDFNPQGYSAVFRDSSPMEGVSGPLSLYNLYKMWGIISESEASGGFVSAIRAGLKYDSRNVENNPTKGIWAEAHVSLAPKFLGTTHPHYRYNLTFHQYIPLGFEKLVFAYRLSYNGFFGNAPWYVMPFYTCMGISADTDGFGGYRTVRGLMLNRVQGLQTGFFNAELRWRFIDFKLWKQNIAFCLSAFSDGIHVFKGYDISNRNEASLAVSCPAANELYGKLVDTSRNDGYHGSAGIGVRFIMNDNFIVAFEDAMCFNRQDGGNAFYINIGFLF